MPQSTPHAPSYPVKPKVGDMVTGLRGLRSRLLEIQEYLEAVVGGKLPVSHDIMRNLQAGVDHCCSISQPSSVSVSGCSGPCMATNRLRMQPAGRCRGDESMIDQPQPIR